MDKGECRSYEECTMRQLGYTLGFLCHLSIDRLVTFDSSSEASWVATVVIYGTSFTTLH